MSTTPNKITAKFKEQVEHLVSEGIVANQQEIVNTLNWNKSQMSQAMKGTKNIPVAVYRKFTETYCLDQEKPANGAKNGSNDDITSKYIALLESKANSEKEILKGLKTNQALLMTMQEVAARLLAKAEKKEVFEIGDQLRKVTEANLKQVGIL